MVQKEAVDFIQAIGIGSVLLLLSNILELKYISTINRRYRNCILSGGLRWMQILFVSSGRGRDTWLLERDWLHRICVHRICDRGMIIRTDYATDGNSQDQTSSET